MLPLSEITLPSACGVHFAGQELIDVEGQQLDSVGIHPAQIGRHQAGGGDFGFVAGNARTLQDRFAEFRQFDHRYVWHAPTE